MRHNHVMNLVILAISTLIGCHNNKDMNIYIDAIEEIHIDVNKIQDSCTYTDIIDSMIIITLDKEPILADIEQIVVRDSNIYILDNSNHNIHMYNKEGKHINTLKTLGRGEGEYICIDCFNVDTKEKTLGILNYDKWQYYSLPEFKYLGEHNTVFEYTGLYVDTNKIYGLYLDSNEIYYPTLQIQDQYSRIDSLRLNYVSGSLSFFSTNNVSLYLSINMSDSYILDKTNDNHFQSRYKINFGKNKIPSSYFSAEESEECYKLYDQLVSTDIQNNSFAGIITNPIIEEDKLFFTFCYQDFYNNTLKTCAYDLHSEEYVLIDKINIPSLENKFKYSHIMPRGTYKSFFVSIIQPELFIPQEASSSDSLTQIVNNAIKDGDKDDGICTPILVLYRIKI